MSRFLKKLSIRTAIAGTAVLLLGIGCYSAGARVNTTKSIPVGLYWLTDEPVEKGAYVVFCPPPVGVFDDAKERGYIGAGFCPGGYSLMMKRVLAAKDDQIVVTAEGVTVNGQLLPLSALLTTDKAGRALPRYQSDRYTLGNVELLLMSDVSGTSFDSRYFGPINRNQIEGVIRPVFIW
ncbi:conjugation peptidase TraF. Serine peptidase. MEROPS family S26C [Azotobacter beijerinckii]|uniref:Conjugation peptidase TraF. Serine peptidase. MEROPS family S26C n=1 Tax=Azotobacter beijerinckii TaxID=170623 RepID=A0A1H9K080_9GAMM|nr:conjugative transfer signal peptidase TraF [Azotobacter beijerinckii]SEQ92499.1 conjugation peptidase TraF. Serine peptidase. MEROPS family S26C [Azotobacter beijerinckii]